MGQRQSRCRPSATWTPGTVTIGIDLGTTYSTVATFNNDDGKVVVIKNRLSQYTTPSAVAFNEDEEEPRVGEDARALAVTSSTHHTNFVCDMKRLIGRSWNDQSVRDDVKNWHFKVVNEGNELRVKVRQGKIIKTYSPEQISALILARLKQDAENCLNGRVDSAVITVPAYFTTSQLRATRKAGELAGLKVLRLVPEPVAAIVADVLDSDKPTPKKVLVFDFGGGTLDICVVHIQGLRIAVKAVDGDSHLGGMDIDKKIYDYVKEEMWKTYGAEINGPNNEMVLLQRCERVKCLLSTSLSPTRSESIDITEFAESKFGKRTYVTLSRAKLDELCQEVLKKCEDSVHRTLNAAKLSAKDIKKVILAGGSTRLPCVQQLVARLFDHLELGATIGGTDKMAVDESVGRGAAYYAASLAGNPHPKLAGLEVLNVIPVSIGTDVDDGRFLVLIPRNQRIPHRMEKQFATCLNDQSAMSFKVFQGERLVADRNRLIGEYLFPLPRGAKRGMLVYGALEVDSDGILKVEARLYTCNRWQGCEIKLNQDVASSEIISSEHADHFREEDERELARRDARFALRKAFGNENGKDLLERSTLAGSIWTWFEDHQDASKEEFEGKLAEFKMLRL